MTDIMQKTKGWFITFGIILIVLGMGAVAVPMVATIAIEAVIGWIFILSGLVTAIHSFRALNTGRCLLRFFGGLFCTAVGVMMLVYPLGGAITLTVLLAIFFLVEGIVKSSVALQIRPAPNWGWMLVSGIAAWVLGILILSGYPQTAAWALGLLVGINFIFSGWTMIMLSNIEMQQ